MRLERCLFITMLSVLMCFGCAPTPTNPLVTPAPSFPGRMIIYRGDPVLLAKKEKCENTKKWVGNTQISLCYWVDKAQMCFHRSGNINPNDCDTNDPVLGGECQRVRWEAATCLMVNQANE